MLESLATVLRAIFGFAWLSWMTVALIGFSPLLIMWWLGLALLWVCAVPLMFIVFAFENDVEAFRRWIRMSVTAWLQQPVELLHAIPPIYRQTWQWIVGNPRPSGS
jgi:hypothetical protein